MNYITISDEAYNEFKGFLDYNNVEKYSLRITYLGRKCSGPVFNISVEESITSDIVEKVKDIKFIMDEDLINEYGGFKILSNEENEGQGLILKPVNDYISNCSICPGC